MRRSATVGVAAVLIALLGACGGSSSKPKLAAKSSSTTTTVAGDASSTTVPGASASSGGNGQGAGAHQPGATTTVPGSNGGSPGTNPPPPKAPGPEVPVTGTLDRSCVHQARASDVQGMTVHMRTNGVVAWDTVYSDNSTELTNKSYTAGYGRGKADDSGVYRATWVVPATAPLGKATVYVLTDANKPPLALPFTIVPPTGSCP